jgi:hypothetical protein
MEFLIFGGPLLVWLLACFWWIQTHGNKKRRYKFYSTFRGSQITTNLEALIAIKELLSLIVVAVGCGFTTVAIGAAFFAIKYFDLIEAINNIE